MRHPLSSVEPLESRIAPAGILYVTFNNGNLTVIGDAGAHEFSLNHSGGVSATLYPGTDTLLNIGNAAPTDTPFEIASLTGDVRIALGGGNDLVSVDQLTHVRNFTLNLGGGENAADFSAINVRGSFTILGGKGSDAISMGGSDDVSIVIGRDFTLKTDQGNSIVSIVAERFEVGGNMRFESGTGDDEFASSADFFRVGGDASFSLSRGKNGLAIGARWEGDIAGKLTVAANSGSGTNTTINAVSDGHFRFGEGLSIATGGSDDEISISGLHLAFAGSVKATTGRGMDNFKIEALTTSVEGNLVLSGGQSLFSMIKSPDGLSVAGDLIFTGGFESDTFVLDATAVIFGHTSINLGRGLGLAGFDYAGVDLRSSNASVDSVFLGGLDIRMSAGADAASGGGIISISQAMLGSRSSIHTGVGGDFIGLHRITVNAPFTIATGNGEDSVFWSYDSDPAENIIAAPISIALEGGDDFILFGGNTVNARSFLSGGAGLDTIDYLERGNVLTVLPTLQQFEVIS